MRHPLLTVIATALVAAPLVAQPAVSAADIDRLTGARWNGTLTYRDYTTDARTSIKAALQLTRAADTTGSAARWTMQLLYADEPQANGRETATLSNDGRRFRDAVVTERAVLADGALRIVTESDGQDNDRPARIRLVYRIGAHAASIQKFVRYAGGEFFERHIYEWTR